MIMLMCPIQLYEQRKKIISKTAKFIKLLIEIEMENKRSISVSELSASICFLQLHLTK